MKPIHILISIYILFAFCFTCYADEIDDIIPCIIQVESGGNPNAASYAGAKYGRGLMQISEIVMEEYCKNNFPQPYGCVSADALCWRTEYPGYGEKSGFYDGVLYMGRSFGNGSGFHYYPEMLFCPELNKKIGEWYLRRLKNHYLKENYTIERMCAAYNGGITRLRNNGYDINKMPHETRDYVRKVMKLYKEAKNGQEK